MAFEPLNYSRSWENPTDFPTYEPDEGQVRKDLQLLHDEARDAINRLVQALNDPTAAALLPFAPTDALSATTVQQAIEMVYAAVQDAAAAKIVDGSVSKGKLTQELLKKIYGGRVHMSMDAPTAADSPDTDLPVGQLWMRPGYEICDLADEQWEVSGGSAVQENGGWVFTTDGMQDYMTASQLLETVGSAGQQILVCLRLGECSSHLEELALYLNGVEYDPTEDEIFETVLDQTGSLEIQLRGQWPYAETDAEITVEELTVINTDATAAQCPDCEPCRDWQQLLRQTGKIPMALWLQTKAGVWQELVPEVLPVQRGGTGLAAVEPGAVLCGGEDGTLTALPGTQSGVLCHHGGKTRWMTPQQLSDQEGFVRRHGGIYEGTGTQTEVQLSLRPGILYIWPENGKEDTVCVANGGRSSRQYGVISGNSVAGYEAYVHLSGDKLSFSCEKKGDFAGQMTPRHMNEPGCRYCYLAVG